VSVTGTMLLTAFFAAVGRFAVEGSFETRAQIANTFARQAQIQQAQIDLEELLRLQIDEENSLRGYLLTRDPFYSAEYRSASAGYDEKEAAIRKTLGEQLVAPISCSPTTRAFSSSGGIPLRRRCSRIRGSAWKSWTKETNSSPTTRR